MSKQRVVFRCQSCDGQAPQWAGRCPTCGAWNSLVEELQRTASPTAGVRTGSAPLPIADVDASAAVARSTGVAELDRVLDGGMVSGSVTLLGGEPGIGKSTLLLQAAAGLTGGGAQVLYVSAEESAAQVRVRADRLGALRPKLWMVAESSLPAVLAAINEVAPDVVVVDSIQTVHDPDVASAAGSVTQVRACAQAFVELAKQRGVTVVLVGHVTKDGSLAGPRTLEHLVDTVLSFEGDRHHALRFLRATKHRFGATHELGVFEMGESGLSVVDDAAGLFLADRRPEVSGSAVVPVLEGSRPLLVELQALAAPVANPTGSPHRSVQGVDRSRVDVVLAVLQQHVGIAVHQADVFVSVVGGVRLVEPGVDLGLALAIASAMSGEPLPPDLVALGEVGLGGEVRQVRHTDRRLVEAARLGFARAIVPRLAPEGPAGIDLIRVDSVGEAVAATGLSHVARQ
jgi:DNA repair protein RadA/Sms